MMSNIFIIAHFQNSLGEKIYVKKYMKKICEKSLAVLSFLLKYPDLKLYYKEYWTVENQQFMYSLLMLIQACV